MMNNGNNTTHYNTGHDNASTSASARLVDEMDGWVDLYKDRSIDGYILATSELEGLRMLRRRIFKEFHRTSCMLLLVPGSSLGLNSLMC